jgi:PadR family transcriptional regulator, regulatory protein AphA
VRSDAALRTFFLWLVEPAEAREHVERERDYWAGVLAELERIRAQPPGTTRKELAFRLALEGGIRTVQARLEWAEWALEQVRSPAWRSAAATPESARR